MNRSTRDPTWSLGSQDLEDTWFSNHGDRKYPLQMAELHGANKWVIRSPRIQVLGGSDTSSALYRRFEPFVG